MPSKVDKLVIKDKKNDKRVKLTDDDKSHIRAEYETGSISINALSRKYGVSKRLIQFTLFPERHEKAKKDFADRQKDGRYYTTEKHRKYMQDHREHKKELYEKGQLYETDNSGQDS